MLSRTQIFIIAAVLFLLISLSFGLGYLVAKQANPAPIIIEKNSAN